MRSRLKTTRNWIIAAGLCGAFTFTAVEWHFLQVRTELIGLKNRAVEYEELKSENALLKQKQAGSATHTNQLFTWITSVRFKGVALDDVDNLVYAVKQGNTEVRVEAAKALRTIGLETMLNTNLTLEAREEWRAAGLKAIPSLLEALKDQDVFVRANAAITLGFFHQEPEQVVPALVSMLDDVETRAAQSAARALSRLQQLALPAVPALLKQVRSSVPERRAAAIDALKQIAPTALDGNQ